MLQIEDDDGGLPSGQDAFHQVPPSRPVVERPKAVRPQRPAASSTEDSTRNPLTPPRNRGQVIDRTPPPRKKDE